MAWARSVALVRFTSLPWYEHHAVADGWQGSPWRTGRHGHGTITRLHPFPTDKTSLVARSLGYLGFSTMAAGAAVGAVKSER